MTLLRPYYIQNLHPNENLGIFNQNFFISYFIAFLGLDLETLEQKRTLIFLVDQLFIKFDNKNDTKTKQKWIIREKYTDLKERLEIFIKFK